MIADAIGRAVEGEDLPDAVMEAAMEDVLAGRATEAQIAALAVALRMKGETASEVAAAARVMRAHALRVELDLPAPVLDTAGTGGDGAGTFNISTVAALVAAAAGVRVAKHGNRAVSSRAGSADVLEALGVRLDVSPEGVCRCVREVGIGFLFAPSHHGALRHAAPVRRQLGLRTVFNLLGPLTNPAGATHHLIGVFDRARVEQMAEVLGLLGVQGAWVVHGEGGLDEVSPSGPTFVARLAAGRVTTTTVSPSDFGLEEAPLAAVAGGDAAHNASIARAVLAGEPGAARTAVLLNAAAALCAAGRAPGPAEGARLAAEAIDSGRAGRVLERLVEVTRGG